MTGPGYFVLPPDGAPWYGSGTGSTRPGDRAQLASARSPAGTGSSNPMAGWITSGPWYGSAGGTPGGGETAAGLTAEPASGGYLILKSNGAVANYHVLLAGCRSD